MAMVINAASRLDRLPMGSFHWRMLRLVGFGMFFDSFDNNMAAGVMAALVKDGWSTMETNAHFISFTFLGLSIGAFLAGMVGDRWGRRFAYQFNLLIFGVASVASALAPSVEWLIACRCLMGIGIGAEYVVGYSTIAEFVPPKRRGWALAIIGLMTMSGGFVVSLVGSLVLPEFGWRPMFIIGGVGALWVWYLRRKLPESPRWLESMGRYDEAETVLRAIEVEAMLGDDLPPVVLAPTAAKPWVPISVLFSRGVIRRTLLAMSVNIVCLMGNYSFSLWVPTFLVRQGLPIGRSMGFQTMITLGAIAGPCLGLLLSDRIGRLRGLIYTVLLCGVTGIFYSLQHSALGVVVCGFLLTTGLTLALALGVGAYTSELFPTEYRFRGAGVAQMVGRASVIASPYIVVAVFDAFGASGVAVAIAAIFFLLAIGLMLFGIETNLKPLEAVAPETDGTGVVSSVSQRSI